MTRFLEITITTAIESTILSFLDYVSCSSSISSISICLARHRASRPRNLRPLTINYNNKIFPFLINWVLLKHLSLPENDKKVMFFFCYLVGLELDNRPHLTDQHSQNSHHISYFVECN